MNNATITATVTATATASSQQPDTIQSRPEERVTFNDVSDHVEAISIAFEKGLVLLNDLIDFLDPLYIALRDRDWKKVIYKEYDANRALQKAFILADILYSMNDDNNAFLNKMYDKD